MRGMSNNRKDIEKRLGVFAREGAKETFDTYTDMVNELRRATSNALGREWHTIANTWLSRKRATGNREIAVEANRAYDLVEREHLARGKQSRASRPGAKEEMGRAEQVMRDGTVHLDFRAAKEWLSSVTDSALRYIITDAQQAAKAMPNGNKWNYYHDLSLTAQDELQRRKNKASRPGAKEEMGFRSVDTSMWSDVRRSFDSEQEAEQWLQRQGWKRRRVNSDGEIEYAKNGSFAYVYTDELSEPRIRMRGGMTYSSRNASRPGAKAEFAFPGVVVKEDAQFIYYYPDEDDRGTFADSDGRGAYTVKSNKTGKPISAKTYRTWDEATNVSNAINAKLPPLKKRKATSSRPGAKSTMAISADDARRIIAMIDDRKKSATSWSPALDHLTKQRKFAQSLVLAHQQNDTANIKRYSDLLEKAGFSKSTHASASDITKMAQLLAEVERAVMHNKTDKARGLLKQIAPIVDRNRDSNELDSQGMVRAFNDYKKQLGFSKSTHAADGFYGDSEADAVRHMAAEDKTCAECEAEDTKLGDKIAMATDPAVGKKIGKLMDEGYPQQQAIAIALDMKRRGEI